MNFWQVSSEEAIKAAGENINGLTSAGAKSSREKYGSNEFEKPKKVSLMARFFAQFKNIMIIVLLISAFISLTLALLKKEYGDLIEAGIIFFIVIVNAIIGVVQEKKAEDSLALLAKKTGTHARVWRDGKLTVIETSEVVVGDIVELKAGDFIPADMRLTKTDNLKLDESIITGESQAVFKNADTICKSNASISEQVNMAFSGTMVTYGSGQGVVVNVGHETQMGKIAKILNKAVKEKSPLEKNIDKIGKVITFGVLAIVIVVFAVELLFSAKLGFLDAFLIAIALAVAAIPESLPAVITIIMALGVERLARHGAIVKALGAVETLGCCNVVCSDKTGTLTENKMQVKHVFTNLMFESAENLRSGENRELLMAIKLCNNATVGANDVVIGDATETSLLKFYNKFKLDAKTYPRIYELPFDSSRKTMTTINIIEGTAIAFSKGATDYLLPKCDKILVSGKVCPLTDNDLKSIRKAHEKMSSQAERIIAVTMKPLSNEILKNVKITEKKGKNIEKIDKNYKAGEEIINNGNIFLGMFGIYDSPRKEVHGAVKALTKAGLKTVMITGDHPETAFSVAKEIGIAKTKSEVLTGQELANITIPELKKRIEKISVFARVTPEDKVKIVKALKAAGKIVAMTGDGVNDAPSLKISDIGASMGSGTDVTKSVADLVLTDNNFETIVVAVKQGRTIYSNIQKTLQFLISTNAVEVLGIFITALLLKSSIFLLPSQILFINLITDSLPAFALGLEPPETDIMERKPRDNKESIFGGIVGANIIYQAFIQSFIVLIMFVISNAKFGNVVASTMVFLTICYMQIIHAINCKTNKSLVKINVFSNKIFNLSFILLFALITLVGLIPFLQIAFNIVSLNYLQWAIVGLASISIVPAVEIGKFCINLSFKRAKSAENDKKTAKIAYELQKKTKTK